MTPTSPLHGRCRNKILSRQQRRLHLTRNLLILVIGSLALGCASAGGSRFAGDVSAVTEPESAPAVPVEAPSDEVRGVAGHSIENRPIEYLVFGEEHAAETVLFIATIHGDEAGGTPLLNRLAERLRAAPLLYAGRRVVIVPVANPDGLAASQRHNRRGVDLNRNFPADNRREDRASYGEAALSEPESRALFDLLRRYPPARVISFHQPVALVDYDGPGAETWARRFAKASGLRIHKLGAQPGSLGSYVGVTMGIPVVTVELPTTVTLAKADIWEVFGKATLEMIAPAPETAAP